jgi:glyceraldehyde 3-phosphate dehydrogenase (phosphorylating)
MVYRVAVNGFGRIGRDVVRAALERGMLGGDPPTGPAGGGGGAGGDGGAGGGGGGGIEIVAVNDLWPGTALAPLLRHDSTFGPLAAEVGVEDGRLLVGDRQIRLFAEKDPAALPWGELGVDLVLESTGRFRTRDDAARHLKAGARKVLISAPGKGVDATIVLGVNSELATEPGLEVVSAASCTTNCAAPMVAVLHRHFGVRHGFLTTVHAYTNDQVVLDTPHKDPRRARSAAVNMIPTSTGAAKAIGLVLPEVAGRLGGLAVRVPVENGSLTDLTVSVAKTGLTAADVNDAFRTAAAGSLAGILRYSADPIVSRDVIGDPSSCVYDSPLTQVHDDLVKIFGWYDNEWGYTNRLLDLAELFAKTP